MADEWNSFSGCPGCGGAIKWNLIYIVVQGGDAVEVGKSKEGPSVRLNCVIKGVYALMLQDMKEKGIIASYPEGVRLALLHLSKSNNLPVISNQLKNREE